VEWLEKVDGDDETWLFGWLVWFGTCVWFVVFGWREKQIVK
jgi:hypothetical protein